MKKNNKHRFAHLDPEKNTGATVSKRGNILKTEVAADPIQTNIKKDLKRVFITIFISIALLIIFYFVNQKYNLLTEFGHLFNL